MKILITGAGGFIGSHLADFFAGQGADVAGTFRSSTKNIAHLEGKIEMMGCDIANKSEVLAVVEKTQPDYVFHMAAQSFVIPSLKDPENTYKINIMGTMYLLEALKDSDAVVCIASSSAAYGLCYPEEIPIKETKEFRPSSPYAVSKAAADMLGYHYWRTYGMKTLRLRFFNTIGPRKTGSAIAEWTKGVAEIEGGLRQQLGVGNLEPVIDITDVADAVSAVWLLARKGKWGDAYNICTGRGNKMKDVLQKIISLGRTEINVVTDPAKLRPSDDPIFIGDNTKLRKLGWNPEMPLEKTLENTLDYWRSEVSAK